MSSVLSPDPVVQSVPSPRYVANPRAQGLANRLAQGASALAAFASTITEDEWQKRVPKDGRKVGVTIHHVASVYPLEIQLALVLAGGQPLVGITWDNVHQGNADHAVANDHATKDATIELLQRNSAAAAAAIRALTDEELDRAFPNSMYSDAILTCQFMLEDHAVRHAFHHLAKIRKALNR